MSIIKKLKEFIYKECINQKSLNENRVYRLHYLYFNNDTIKEMHDCCCETTSMLNKFGFKLANDLRNVCKPVDLFSVICNNCSYMFKNSEYYKQYFE